METRLRELMTERGLTAQRLADMVGCQKSGIDSVMARGVSSMSKALTYAKALKVHVWELFMEPSISAIDHPVTTWSTSTRIVEIMKERNINQPQMAEILNVSRPNITKAIHSDNISLTTLEAFADAFRLPVWQLLVSPEEYHKEMARRCSDAQQPTAEEPKPTQEAVEPQPNDEATTNNNEPSMWDVQTDTTNKLTDGIYRYGNLTIVLKEGRVSFGA